MSREVSSADGFKPLTRHRDEERYFFERDAELVRELRERATRERTERERAEQQRQHWMRCPKCGDAMQEIAFDVLVLDRCQGCRGVYFDQGELSILREVQAQGPGGARDVVSQLIARLDAE